MSMCGTTTAGKPFCRSICRLMAGLDRKNYVLPEYEEYKRLLPAGGTVGQSLIKKTDTDFDVEWGDGAIGEEITEEQIDEICK